MMIYNNNPFYGFGGPFEASSFEALADAMQPNFEEWANDGEYADMEYNEAVNFMRREFIQGLEEVK